MKDIRTAKQYYGYQASKIDCPFAKEAISQMFIGEYLRSLDDLDNVIVDTRVHMLKKGWYPCIPGWHLDEVKRDSNDNLDWDNDQEKHHFLYIIDEGTGSMTEFVKEDYYNRIKDFTELNKIIELESPEKFITQNKTLYYFTNRSAHRGLPATGNGWRYFFRATTNSQREFTNEIRTQTQVYLPAINVGW